MQNMQREIEAFADSIRNNLNLPAEERTVHGEPSTHHVTVDTRSVGTGQPGIGVQECSATLDGGRPSNLTTHRT